MDFKSEIFEVITKGACEK